MNRTVAGSSVKPMNRPAETEHRIFVCAGSNATVIIYCDCDWEKELEYEVPVDQILMEAFNHQRGRDDRDPIQKFLDDPSNWAGGKFPRPSWMKDLDPCRNCDAIECGDESWPRPICCEGCTHGR